MALELFQTGSTFTVTDADLVPGGDPEVVYTLRYFTSEDADRLRKAAITKKYNATKQAQEETFDSTAYGESVINHVLVEWTNVTRNGEPLPCVLSNKRIMPAERRGRMVSLAQENVQVKAVEQAASFSEA